VSSKKPNHRSSLARRFIREKAMSERYKEWNETKHWPSNLYLQALHDDYEGFRLLLEDKVTGAVYRLAFDSNLAYRNIDEGDLLRSTATLIKTRTSIVTVYEVENSEWLRWFREESNGKYDSQKIYHWTITTPNDWIDVLSIEPPITTKLTI
jgi:hypothetical protein